VTEGLLVIEKSELAVVPLLTTVSGETTVKLAEAVSPLGLPVAVIV